MFALVDQVKFLNRSYLLLQAFPEVFLSGFLWQAFGYACGCDNTSTSYFFLTGFGGALGAMFGHILSKLTVVDGMLTLPRRARNKSIANFIAMFLGSATTWRKVANDTNNLGMDFWQAFFFVWFVSFVIFLSTLAVLRGLSSLYKYYTKGEQDVDTLVVRFFYDVQLAISVATADAFFLGTVSGFYSNNILGGMFGTTDDTPKFESLMKSGTAGLVGFCLVQAIQNLFIVDCWIDRPPSNKVPDNKVPLIL